MTRAEGSATDPDRPVGRPAPSGGTTPALRVLVAGAGAIGQWLGLRLLQTGQNVLLLARPRHVTAIRSHGLKVTGLTEAHAMVAVVADLDDVKGDFDLIVLTCKAHQTAALGGAVARRLSPTGIVLSLQNGLGNAEKLRRSIPVERLAIGLTSHGVTVERPGLLHHAGEGPTLVGPLDGQPPAAAQVAYRILEQARLRPEWQDRIRGFVWRKAVVNSGINPVGALNGLANGQILASPRLREQCLGLVREAEAVARAAKVALPPGDLAQVTAATLGRTAANRCSMLQDVEAQRPTEVEQITGRIVRLGARLGVPTPLGSAVYERVKALEASYLGAAAAAKLTRDEVAWETDGI